MKVTVASLAEQHFRAHMLLTTAVKYEDRSLRWRLLMAALYPAVAIDQQLREVAGEGLDSKPRSKKVKALLEELDKRLPYRALLDRIRAEDFHRGTVDPLPTEADGVLAVAMYGGVTLTTGQGQGASAAIAGIGPGFREMTTGSGGVRHEQNKEALHQRGESFMDPTTRQWVDFARALAAYLNGAQPVGDLLDLARTVNKA